MTESYEDILRQSLSQLHAKKSSLEEDLNNVENAISGIQGLLDNEQQEQPSKENGNVEQQVEDHPKKRSPKKVSESEVRDAVLTFAREPFPEGARPRDLKDGFFLISHIADILDVHVQNNGLRNALAKFVSKGILEAEKFRNGTQYRYIPPAETGPGVGEALSRLYKDSAQNGGGSDPVPGTGNGKIHARDKDVEKLLHTAQRQGFLVERRGSDHIYVKNTKNKAGTTISSTSNSSHHVARVRSDLAKIGVRF